MPSAATKLLTGFFALTCLLSSAICLANDGFNLEELSLQRDGQAYTVNTTLTLRADVSKLRRLLASPEVLPDLNPRIEKVDVLAPGAAASGAMKTRVRLVSRRCVILFCRRYQWTQSISVAQSGDVVVRFEPNSESVSEGEIRYRMRTSEAGITRLQVSARVVPNFALPPFLGSALMRSMVLDDLRAWASNMTAVARRI